MAEQQQPAVSQMTSAEHQKYIIDQEQTEEQKAAAEEERKQDEENRSRDEFNAKGRKNYENKAYGGKVNKMAKGGKVKKSNKSRGDGIAQRGKTKGRMV
jgi:hypothetical protein